MTYIYPNNQQRQDEVLRQHELLERLDTLDETIAVARGASAGALAAVAAGVAAQKASHEKIMAEVEARFAVTDAKTTALLAVPDSLERVRQGLVEIQTILDREKRLREEERRAAPAFFPPSGEEVKYSSFTQTKAALSWIIKPIGNAWNTIWGCCDPKTSISRFSTPSPQSPPESTTLDKMALKKYKA